MVASSLREGREDHTSRRKSEVIYHSETKGSEEKTVFGTNPQSRTDVRSARTNAAKRPDNSRMSSFIPELRVGREDRPFRLSRRFGTNPAYGDGKED